MDKPTRYNISLTRLTTDTFLNVEHGIYGAIGFVLAITALIALIDAGLQLWAAAIHWDADNNLLLVMDRLLFVLMMAEILHTVRVSIRSGALTCEPFLIVGLIASIRRVLVIPLKSSQTNPEKVADAAGDLAFRTSMIELGVLAGLILVMVFSIVMIRLSARGQATSDAFTEGH